MMPDAGSLDDSLKPLQIAVMDMGPPITPRFPDKRDKRSKPRLIILKIGSSWDQCLVSFSDTVNW